MRLSCNESTTGRLAVVVALLFFSLGGFYALAAVGGATAASVNLKTATGEIQPARSVYTNVDPVGKDDIFAIYEGEAPEPRVADFANGGLRASNCFPMGGFQDIPTSRTTLFHGNVFTTEIASVLNEIRVELQFAGTKTITFAVYRQQVGTEENDYDLIWSMAEVDFASTSATSGQWYSTGEISPPISITPREDLLGNPIPTKFAVAVGWNESGIYYGRNSPTVNYPVPWGVGELEGLWLDLGQNPIPVPDPYSISSIYPQRTISMDLCFKAPGGACCLTTGECLNDVTEDTCLDTYDGTFLGTYSICEMSECEPIGACCYGNGICDVVTEQACADSNGIYKGDGVQCDADPAPCNPDHGACCRYDGSCDESGNEFDCENDPNLDTPGSWKGYHVSCGSSTGECLPMGACCDDSDCEDTTEDDCPLCMITTDGPCPSDMLTGNSWIKGQPCIHDSCDGELGACCINGECEITVPLACSDQGGVFTPAGTNGWQACDVFLSTNSCPADQSGACCLDSGACVKTADATECANQSGEFQGLGITCSDFICAVGACCYDDAGTTECAQVRPMICVDTNGLYSGEYRGPGTLCRDECQEIGACCLATGCDDTLTKAQCEAVYGEYLGNETTCSPDACDFGACCYSDMGTNACIETVKALCEDPYGVDGRFSGVGTTCPADCIPLGACCNYDGSCTIETPAGCAAVGGVYHGDGTDCVGRVCDTYGACCVSISSSSSACYDMLESDCASVAGYFQAGLHCEDHNSCKPGTCCELDGTCSETTKLECAQIEYAIFDESITSCGLATCEPRGACCLEDRSCAILTSNGCANSNGVYRGDATLCEADTCEWSACCVLSACTDMLTDQCTSAGGAPAPIGVMCDSGACDAGACCYTVGSYNLCENVTYRFECEDDVPPVKNGTFLGVGTVCTIDESCDMGSCCEMDGSCEEVYRGACEVSTTAIFTDGGNCSPNVCEIRGACCESGTCSEGTEADCIAVGGIFGNPGQLCSAGICDEGACCTGTNGELCEVITELECSTMAGSSYGGAGTICDRHCYCNAAYPGIAVGDYDGDGDVDLNDSSACSACMAASPQSDKCKCAFDFDLDGIIDTDDWADFVCVYDYPYMNSADYDGDGDTDLMDFAYFQDCFSDTPMTDACRCAFDSNKDGTLDLVDYADFISHMDR